MSHRRASTRTSVQATDKPEPTHSVFLILIVVLTTGFLGSVLYQTYDAQSIKDHQEIERMANASKVCLLSFQEKRCSPINLTQDCERLYECTKMADGDDFIQEAKEIADTFTQELGDCIAIPGLLLTIIIVGKILMLMHDYESTLRKKEN